MQKRLALTRGTFLIHCLALLCAGIGAVGAALPLERLSLPPGFSIDIFASDVENARAMARGQDGTIYVGSRGAGKVYALPDADGDQRADRVIVIDSDLRMPSGLAYHQGNLYVAAVSRVLRYDDIGANLDQPPEPVVVTDALPTDRHHGWKYLDIGPDGKLYIPVGAPCNICNEPGYAKIKRMNLDGSELQDYVHGVRNSVGFDFHPLTGDLWFTDNGRDHLGDNSPPCELNHVSEAGQHFGYPFCHGGTVADPEYGDQRPCSEFVAPAQALGPHVAPLGMTFYTGDLFPERYRHQVFIAEHGSWNRSEKIGYRITLVELEGDKAVSYQPFVSGWHEGNDVWGRPVDLLVMPDGALLISDDYANVIYRLVYQP